MLLGMLLIVIAGIIYYSTHQIPPDPIFKEEVYVEEEDFWDEDSLNDMEAKYRRIHEVYPYPELVIKTPNQKKKKKQEKNKKRRKRKIAKKSRRVNRN